MSAKSASAQVSPASFGGRRRSSFSDRRHSAAIPADTPRASDTLRFFFNISFVAIVVAAMLLVLAFRYFTIQAVAEHTGASNSIIAAVATHQELIADFLVDRQTHSNLPLPEAIATSLNELVRGTPVKYVRIIDAQRQVAFSSKVDPGMDADLDNNLVGEALQGKQVSKFNYRDLINSFAFESDPLRDNIVVTLLPLQRHQQGPVLGLFEIRTDVSPIIRHNERAQLMIAGTALLIMLLLYESLLAAIRRTGSAMDLQQDAVRERSDQIVEFSTTIIHAQEAEKQRISQELHERVAQTLAAIKLNIESQSVHMQRDNPQTALELRSLLAPILEAIELVRATASNLRPSSLDDLGLLSSLTFLWRKLAIERPDLNINYKLLLEEQEVPVALRETIFRTAEAASAAVAAMQSAKNAEFLLGMEDDKIVLTIHDDALPHCAVPDAQNPFSCVRDITTISGGNYFCNCTPLNGNVVKASWSY